MPGDHPKDLYAVAVKAFLERDGSLFIFRDRFGDWDLPGGRLLPNEFGTPLEDVLRRKMLEELGGDLEYQIAQANVLMRHQRVERAPGNPTVRIFAVGYPVQHIAGEPQLSQQHTESKWVHLSNLDPHEYFTGGWLDGTLEFLRLRHRRPRD